MHEELWAELKQAMQRIEEMESKIKIKRSEPGCQQQLFGTPSSSLCSNFFTLFIHGLASDALSLNVGQDHDDDDETLEKLLELIKKRALTENHTNRYARHLPCCCSLCVSHLSVFLLLLKRSKLRNERGEEKRTTKNGT